MLKSINPTNGKFIQEYSETPLKKCNVIVTKAKLAYLKWRTLPFSERAYFLKEVAKQLRTHKVSFAKLMATEMGKPISQGQTEVEKCAWCCDFFAEHAESFLQPEKIQIEGGKSFVVFQPLGVILGIMPWNFPFWQVFRFVVPTLMAGNTVVVKHASNVSGCALAIQKVFEKAKVPENVFNLLLVEGSRALQLIAHPLICGVSLTGSVEAGRAVARKAGEVLKKTVLELGGSDPYILLEDANLEQAVEKCVTSRLTNTGQSCIAAKRFIVVKSQLKKFQEHLVERMQAVKMGNPIDPGNHIGPLARFDIRYNLHNQVTKSIEQGAKYLLGGKLPKEKKFLSGAFYPPTVLTNVRKGMPAYHEELFGPVAVVISAKDERDAISIANDSSFGLGAAIFTQDKNKGEKLAVFALEAGSCFVNTLVKSDPRLPFGGIKASGYGRELSHYGIKEFVNIKTVHVV